jgi:hypothetical protein
MNQEETGLRGKPGGSAGEQEIPLVVNNQDYLVQLNGGELRLGRRAGETVLWQEDTVPIADLPGDARVALESGDVDSPALTIALEGILEAFIQRGG